MVCLYYCAQLKKEHVWLITATLKSFEHLAFDRTIDKQQSIFEFFVPELNKSTFVAIMNRFQDLGYITWWEERENRLLTEHVL